MPSQHALREEITARIVAALEKDLLPWRRTWSISGPGRHTNIVSKKPYSGVNPILCEMHAQQYGFQSQWWATFNQWKERDCIIKPRPKDVEPGHWGCGIVLYLPVTKEAKDPVTGDKDEEKYWLLRKFTLFNAEQVEGLGAEKYQPSRNPASTVPDFAPAEELIAKTGAEFGMAATGLFIGCRHRKALGRSIRSGDYIQLPHKGSFISGGYYPTALHELGHWSEVRLGWDREKHGYAMGELVAELSSCYLAGELGVPNGDHLENHAAYLKSWLESMKNDASYVFQAAKQASKVTDSSYRSCGNRRLNRNPNWSRQFDPPQRQDHHAAFSILWRNVPRIYWLSGSSTIRRKGRVVWATHTLLDRHQIHF